MGDERAELAKIISQYFNQGQLDLARAELQKLLAMAPQDAAVHFFAAEFYARVRQVHEAYQEYQLAADMYTKLGMPDKLLAVQKKITELDPSSLDEASRAKIRLLQMLIVAEERQSQGDMDGAIAQYQQTIQAFPNHTAAYQHLANLFIRLGRTDEAVQQYLGVARAYFSHQLFAKAEPYYRRILDLQPAHEEAQQAFQKIAETKGERGEAGKYFVIAVERALQTGALDKAAQLIAKLQAMGHEDALYLLGILYAKQGRREEAKTALAQFVRTAKQYSKALMQLGQLFETENRLDLALKCYLRAAQDPAAEEAGLRAKGLQQRLQAAKPAEAPPSSNTQAPEAEPAGTSGTDDEESSLVTMGDMCLAEEMFDEAKQVFEKLLRLQPGNNQFFEKLNVARQGMKLAPLPHPQFAGAHPAQAPVQSPATASPVAQVPMAASSPAVSEPAASSAAITPSAPTPVAEKKEEEVARVQSLAAPQAEPAAATPAVPAPSSSPMPVLQTPQPTAPVSSSASQTPAEKKGSEQVEAALRPVLPPRQSSLPKDPLDFLMQLEGGQINLPTQAAPPLPPLPIPQASPAPKPLPPLPVPPLSSQGAGPEQVPPVTGPEKATAAAEKPLAMPEPVLAAPSQASRGTIAVQAKEDKPKITRAQYEMRPGILPPSAKSSVVVDDDIIE